MFEAQHLYIDGEWTESVDGTVQDLTDPATGRPSGCVVLCGTADADRAIRAACRACPARGATSVAELAGPLKVIGAEYARRAEDMAAGGPGKPDLPDDLHDSRFVKPAVFVGVTNDMAIAREEIFGPVLSVIVDDTVEEAVRIANDSPFGLCGYVTSADPERARVVAEQLRIGYVLINDADFDFNTAWGGHKQSRNGREWADFGIGEYLETKSIVGVSA